MKLAFGVIDIMYAFSYGEDTVDPTITTGDVAEILEEKYGIMSCFFEMYEEQINAIIIDTITDAFTDAFDGLPVDLPTLLTASLPEIHVLFEEFILTKKMDGKVDGVPTKRSIDGINHRKKLRSIDPYRPSFLDSRLYMSSFRAELSE